MKSTKLSLTKNGLTFSRWNYTGRPTIAERRRYHSTAQQNADSPWWIEITSAEINDDLELTGDHAGAVVKIWAHREIIKIEGAERFTAADALAIGHALQTANELMTEFKDRTRCPNHGTGEIDECEACWIEMEAELDAKQARS